MNKYSFSYEDTDKKIEIELYGLVFQIKGITKEKLKDLDNVEDNDIERLEKELDNILGDGAVEKINNKRVADGHEKMSLDVISMVWGFIFDTYTKRISETTTNMMNKSYKNAQENVNRYNNRNYNRNYNRNKYRRY